MRIKISALVLAYLAVSACGGGGGGGGGGDSGTPLPGPYQLTFSLDASFQTDHGNQQISIAVVRSSDGVVVAEDIGIVSATQNPSFSFDAGTVLERGIAYEVHYWIDSNIDGGTIGVCDPKAIDHQWSVELLSPTNDVDFTVSHNPTLTEDVCSTFM